MNHLVFYISHRRSLPMLRHVPRHTFRWSPPPPPSVSWWHGRHRRHGRHKCRSPSHNTTLELRLAAAGWLGGFGNPPPLLPPPPPWLAGWLAGAPKYVVHHCIASSHAWYGYGDGFARVGGVGHLSRTPLPHTPSCLAFGTSHKDHIESPH